MVRAQSLCLVLVEEVCGLDCSGGGSLVGHLFLTCFGTAKSLSEFIAHTER